MTELKPMLVLACVALTMALSGVARADPPAACWSAAALAGRPEEVAKHRPGPSDQVSVPQASL